MARPRKCRRVCGLPEISDFGPVEKKPKDNVVLMSVEEYETIRLIDWEGLTQEECGKQMEVARTTVQSIYMAARRKLADCLVNGKLLKIEGGDYRVCTAPHLSRCGKTHCCKKLW